ncbi:hypothetical protein F8388_004870 [Cannabis sativa]|uniref:Uncharacterized protein n=1 Tax=Cannabis sativa TaxID=3483 RepID=A0A7J6HNS0_CANSA|nr:hypothetical protein F8388_004870 [Cannabis sativa]
MERLSTCHVRVYLEQKGSGEWDEEFVRAVFNPTNAELILQMATSECDIEDKILWHYSKDGEYSVRSGYLTTTLKKVIS